jgi:dethiobiotin synthetase
MRGLFVTGTGTGAGKSVVAACICAALRERGDRVAAFKPVVTGLDEEPGDWPRDHELLASAAGVKPETVTPYLFGPPLSPHFAAQLAGGVIDPERVLAAAREAASGADVLVAEGVGGLLVPIAPDWSVRDLAVALGLPLVVATRTGLGTINHTLLSVEAARHAGLEVCGVVMTPWPGEPAPIEVSNRETIERLAGVPVAGLPPTAPDRLAEAGAALPLAQWLP